MALKMGGVFRFVLVRFGSFWCAFRDPIGSGSDDGMHVANEVKRGGWPMLTVPNARR